MRIIYWIYLLSTLCLILLPGPCTAWDLVSFSPEAISNSPLDETIQLAAATVPFDTGDALASLSSSPENSIPIEQDRRASLHRQAGQGGGKFSDHDVYRAGDICDTLSSPDRLRVSNYRRFDDDDIPDYCSN